MRSCGIISATLVGMVAIGVYVLLSLGLHQAPSDSREPSTYELGSGLMFDAIAPRYDLINKVISLGLDMRWRRAMVNSLQLRPGDRVVDMATGTADVAVMIAERLDTLNGVDKAGESALPVIGIDPSAKMLDVGRMKAAKAGLSSKVQLRLGDAQDLADVSDASVDKVTMAFGIRNVPDRLRALRELRRILDVSTESRDASASSESSSDASGASRDGPVVAILELQNPEDGLLASVSSVFIRYAAPLLGWAMSGSGAEYGHLKNSIMNFPSVSEWTQLMRQAGLEVFSHTTMGFGTVHLYLARPLVNVDA